jgi:hypothetical protein
MLLFPLTMRETAVEAMRFCFLWFLANYFSNAALQYTNVPSFTIISSMSGFFTLYIGVSVGVENFTWLKLSALVISFSNIKSVLMVELVVSQLSHCKTLKTTLQQIVDFYFSATLLPCSEQVSTVITLHFSSYAFNMRAEWT